MSAIIELNPRPETHAAVWLTSSAVLCRLHGRAGAAMPDKELRWAEMRQDGATARASADDSAVADFATDHFLTNTLQRRFEVYAQTNPGAVAIRTASMQVTFGELDAQADGLAVLLQQRGLGPGDICCIAMAPSIALARAMLAVLKAGAACALMDPRRAPHAASRPASMALLLTADAEPDIELDIKLAMAADQPTLTCAEDGSGLPYAWPQEYPTHRLSPAFAVPVAAPDNSRQWRFASHLSVMADLLALQSVHALGHGDALLQSPHGGASTYPWEVLWPLSQGARLEVPAARQLDDPELLRQLVRRKHIAVMHLLPALRRLLLDAGDAGESGDPVDGLDSLRAVFCTAPAPMGAAARASRRHSEDTDN